MKKSILTIGLVIRHESNASRFQKLLENKSIPFLMSFYSDDKTGCIIPDYLFEIDDDALTIQERNSLLFVLDGRVIPKGK